MTSTARSSMALQRRKALVSEDPLDGMSLRRAAERVREALLDRAAAILLSAERDHRSADSLDYRERVVSLLDAPAPGAPDLYMRAIEDASDALMEAVRLERLKSPEDYNRPFLQALFNRHLAGADRASVIMSLAYWLLAPGGDVGVVFGVL